MSYTKKGVRSSSACTHLYIPRADHLVKCDGIPPSTTLPERHDIVPSQGSQASNKLRSIPSLEEHNPSPVSTAMPLELTRSSMFSRARGVPKFCTLLATFRSTEYVVRCRSPENSISNIGRLTDIHINHCL